MKRHIQEFGVKPWAGQDLLDLQSEPFKVLDSFFQEYGPCIIKGCEITPEGNLFSVSPGLVALAGKDSDGAATFKAVPFAGAGSVTLPLYLTLTHTIVTRPYADKKVRPIAYDYQATATTIQPTDVPFLEITATGARRFVDAIKVTEKLDKTGNGRDVSVTFAEAAERANIASGEKLSVLFSKIAKWLAGLKAVAFTGKAADLEQDTTHRLVTDAEKTAWADKYTRTEVEQKIAAIVDSAPGTLDTLKELAAALGNDPNFATSIMTLIGGKADTSELNKKYDKTGGTITGMLTAPALSVKNESSSLIVLDVTNSQYDNSAGKSSSLIFRSAIPERYGEIRATMKSFGDFDRFDFIAHNHESSENVDITENLLSVTRTGLQYKGHEVWQAGNLNPNDFQPKQPFSMSTRTAIGYFGIYIPTAQPGDYIEFWSSAALWYGIKCGNLDVFGTAKVNNKEIATTDQLDTKAPVNHTHAGTMKVIIAGHVFPNSNKAADCAGRDFTVVKSGNTYTITHMLNIASYHVMATGGNSDVGQAYAALVAKNANSFTIRTADDTTGLDAEFYFTMYEIV